MLARLHTVAAAGLTEALGRPRAQDQELAARLESLFGLLEAPSKAPALVLAAVVHAELAVLRPFGTADGVVARSAERLTLVEYGLDPKSLVAVEVGHLELPYADGLRAYLRGTPDGVAEWVRHCAAAVTLGVRETTAICEAIAEGLTCAALVCAALVCAALRCAGLRWSAWRWSAWRWSAWRWSARRARSDIADGVPVMRRRRRHVAPGYQACTSIIVGAGQARLRRASRGWSRVGAWLTHPDKWSVSPFYDGSALMGTPRTKTFTRAGPSGGEDFGGSWVLLRLSTCDDHAE